MLYELINPSDPYTFKADTYEIAALTTLCMGTAYGAKPQKGENEVPVFFIGDPEEWYKETFGRTIAEGLEANRHEVAKALDSMLYGNFDDRTVYESAMEAITDTEKKKAFKDQWQDRHSSMNGIGSYAHKMAEILKSKS